MIQIQQVKLHIDHTEADLRSHIQKVLHIKEDALLSYQIKKKSLDARKKPQLFYVYTIDVTVKQEERVMKRNKKTNVKMCSANAYVYPEKGEKPLTHRPIIVGSGPAGLFCAYLLAEMGYRPLLIERGAPVEERIETVKRFWETGILDSNSNVQFGEGGAGTFSDGKLNSVVKDVHGRHKKVLQIFVDCGAPPSILYDSKPHIGTDLLVRVIQKMREIILRHGGEIRFHEQMLKLQLDTKGSKTCIAGICTKKENEESEHIEQGELVILAIGHSARDTFENLYKQGISMEAKSFAVGVRVEHSQNMIDAVQYGTADRENLPAASYKFTTTLPNQRAVYTFCMCPGGYVVNASSEEKRLAVNGMSYHNRDGANANSAVIVTITPEDYGTNGVLEGVKFQRLLEERAYQIGNGKIPIQRFGDFCSKIKTTAFGSIVPTMKGSYTLSNVRDIFPDFIAESLQEGILEFDKSCKGYADPDAILSGVESRTSSPIRILRDAEFESEVKGLYPCGEGAGYAGGITSAAIDGLKIAEIIAKKHQSFDTACE